MDEAIEKQDVDLEQNNESVEAQEDVKDEKPKRTPEEELKYFEGRAARLRKQLGVDKPDEKPAEKPSSSTGELDYGQKAYLTATMNIKGSAEWALVREYLANGKSIDDLIDNRHFKNDLQDLRDAAEAKAATPTSTKRSGSSGNDFEVALAKYEQSGELPKDFTLRAKIIDAKMGKSGDQVPPWHR